MSKAAWEMVSSSKDPKKNIAEVKTLIDNYVGTMTRNNLLSRSAQFIHRGGEMYAGKRDTFGILGYKPRIEFRDYLAKYERQDVAARIVDMPAQETWRRAPVLKSVENVDEAEDEFSKDWKAFARDHKVYHYLERIDRISGIGRFGVIMFGLDDVTEEIQLREPVSIPEGDGSLDLLYIQVFHEGDIEIEIWDEDPFSPRYGLPEVYKLKFRNFLKGSIKTSKTKEILVHHTRCMHVAEEVLDDEIFGKPRLEKCYNLLDDLLKIAGGSAEMFWQNVAITWQLDIDKDTDFRDEDLVTLEEKFYESLHGLRRLVQTEGAEIKPLGGATPDPRGAFAVTKALTASAAQIPQRILFGAEEGELASTQDTAEWYGRIEARQQRFAEPNLLREFVRLMALYGLITIPAGGYEVDWPTLFVQSDANKAENAKLIAEAVSKYSPRAAHKVVTPGELRNLVGLPAKKMDDDLEDEVSEFIREMEELSHSDAGRGASSTTTRDANLEVA